MLQIKPLGLEDLRPWSQAENLLQSHPDLVLSSLNYFVWDKSRWVEDQVDRLQRVIVAVRSYCVLRLCEARRPALNRGLYLPCAQLKEEYLLVHFWQSYFELSIPVLLLHNCDISHLWRWLECGYKNDLRLALIILFSNLFSSISANFFWCSFSW